MVLFLPLLMGGAVLGGFGVKGMQTACTVPGKVEEAPNAPLRRPTSRPLWATSQDDLSPEFMKKVGRTAISVIMDCVCRMAGAVAGLGLSFKIDSAVPNPQVFAVDEAGPAGAYRESQGSHRRAVQE